MLEYELINVECIYIPNSVILCFLARTGTLPQLRRRAKLLLMSLLLTMHLLIRWSRI